eukprot:scaffold615993_cov59-Attheya_sp.AAC.1
MQTPLTHKFSKEEKQTMTNKTMHAQLAEIDKRMKHNDSPSNSNTNMEGKPNYYLVVDELRGKSNKV